MTDPNFEELLQAFHYACVKYGATGNAGLIKSAEAALVAYVSALQSERDNLRRVFCQSWPVTLNTTDARVKDFALREFAAGVWGRREAEALYPPELDGTRPWATVVRSRDAEPQREIVMEMEKGKAP
jgi:hypothetical protein